MAFSGRPTRAVVDLAALGHNLAEARRLAGGRRLIGVVKADAYGHGAEPVARRLVEAGCERLAVISVAEAAALRAADVVAPLLVLGGVHDPEEALEAVVLDCTVVLHHPGQAALLASAASAQGVRVRVEVEIDSAMRRMGVAPEQAAGFLDTLRADPALELTGLFTHLASADDPDPEPARAQLDRFGALLAELRAKAPLPPDLHVANSAGLLATAELVGHEPPTRNSARPGLMLYGVSPAPHLAARADLRPVMSLRSRVVAVRDVRPGDAVGYAGSFRAVRAGRIATVPAGYADGIPWSLSGRGLALVQGRPTSYAGRVSMDYVTLDVGDAPVAPGDEVVLYGRSEDGQAVLAVEDLAARAGTLPYELLVRVGGRVPRLYE